ncbi:MAG: aconitate hydratase AcnA [Rickettsiaceae bacterium H1]|nr:aconitate hydratase AcnA [Rickettsiaceae bacterium H1]
MIASMNIKQEINSNNQNYNYYDLSSFEKKSGLNIAKLPKSLKILAENLLRHNEDNFNDVRSIINRENKSIYFYPARILMQDFTGVPALVDLASMRVAAKKLDINPKNINPSIPVDLVIDHSVQVDRFGNRESFKQNVSWEMKRNYERYKFLKWGQGAFNNFRVVPPGMGICHQVNLEYLAKVVWQEKVGNKELLIYPDTVVGTDSHTTMVNGLSVLGWGVGGIEAESVMLGQPIAMLIPEVFGVKLTGSLREGITATDLVLNVTNVLREIGVVGKFVEFYGSGLQSLSLSDRATIANMAPEYGATCGFFPVDEKTIEYLKLTGRDNVKLVEHYARIQGLWNEIEPEFAKSIEINLKDIEPTLAGPKRPQDKTTIKNLPESFFSAFPTADKTKNDSLHDGSIVIAAITSCTNTSNPSVMIAAGLVARNALKLGLTVKPWVKTSLAPGSKVVTEYLEKSGLQNSLDDLGFNLVGYGCTTCIGNSGPLPEEVSTRIKDENLIVGSVLSGNRNFEGRIHPQVKANYLASPPLVVAYALAGSVNIDLNYDPIEQDNSGKNIYLKDIWPSNDDVKEVISKIITPSMFKEKYSTIFDGDEEWQSLNSFNEVLYRWDEKSTYVQNPPYFANLFNDRSIGSIKNARIIAMLGDSVTTDHISPAGNISVASPAGKYLQSLGIDSLDFNSYGSRRGNHNVMMRGTFANIRIKNEMLDNVEGGFTKHIPTGEVLPIYDAAMLYKKENVPLIVIAGKEYGTGSSRDWAAKGTALLGIKAVIAESFERIHRSNLVGMGVLPLMFQDGINRKKLGLTGNEVIDIDLSSISSGCEVNCEIRKDHSIERCKLLCRIDTEDEMNYFTKGGILQAVLLGRNNR